MATMSFQKAKAAARAAKPPVVAVKSAAVKAAVKPAPTPPPEAADETMNPPVNRGSFVVEDKGGEKFPLIPAEVHRGVLVALYDVGTQETAFGSKRKMVVVWELPELLIEVERDGQAVTMARNISQRYTMSLNEKAALRRDVEAVRGKRLTKEEAKAFDLSSLLGMNAQLQVVHVSKGEEVYANIGTIMAVPRGMPVLSPTVDPVLFHFGGLAEGEATDEAIPQVAPRWVRKLIMASPEWAAAGGAPYQEPVAD